MNKKIESFYINDVRYNQNNASIKELSVFPIDFTPKAEYNLNFIKNKKKSFLERKKIVENIENKNAEYFTIYKDNSDKKEIYRSGSYVEIFKINGISYLKTENNNKRNDNLENLTP